MLIRECEEADLAALERQAPTGPNRWHALRFNHQMAGDSTFLVAWYEGVPVGHGEVLWDRYRDPAVRSAYPDCPEINGLAVYPATLRGRGIGTALIRTAEERARERSCARIGLGVADDNPEAARLYARLGYLPGIQYEGSYTYRDDAGAEHVVVEQVTFLTRRLVRAR